MGYSTPRMSYVMDSDPWIGNWKSALMVEFSQKGPDESEVEMLSEKAREEMKVVLTVGKWSLQRRNSGGKREGRNSCQVREGRVEQTRGNPVNTHWLHLLGGVLEEERISTAMGNIYLAWKRSRNTC